VLRGNIRNVETKDSLNAASHALELIPNNTRSSSEPVNFFLTFTDDNIPFEYEISLDLGTFLEADHARSIVKETLSVNKVKLFTRSDDLVIGDLEVIKPYLVPAYEKMVSGLAKEYYQHIK